MQHPIVSAAQCVNNPAYHLSTCHCLLLSLVS
nr:MAG TPA: Integrin beta-1-binding protein [Caudoviricetes sp.]